ncbi:MAG: hypothetical protein WCN99_04250 [bacterium]
MLAKEYTRTESDQIEFPQRRSIGLAGADHLGCPTPAIAWATFAVLPFLVDWQIINAFIGYSFRSLAPYYRNRPNLAPPLSNVTG